MRDRNFLDTNIFIYTFDASARRKRRIADDLVAEALRDEQGVVSFQVVQEFCAVAVRKFTPALSAPDLCTYVTEVLAPMCEVHSSMNLYQSCLNIREQTGYAFYDSLILAAAASASCEVLYSEDLHDGQTVAGVKIINPFR